MLLLTESDAGAMVGARARSDSVTICRRAPVVELLWMGPSRTSNSEKGCVELADWLAIKGRARSFTKLSWIKSRPLDLRSRKRAWRSVMMHHPSNQLDLDRFLSCWTHSQRNSWTIYNPASLQFRIGADHSLMHRQSTWKRRSLLWSTNVINSCILIR